MRKVIVSGMIANGLEWYDYALFGLLAPIISVIFFPEGDKTTALIATYGIFAAGFIMRPVGAVLFGYLGDKYGRKASLVISIMLMAVPTACIGLLPTYAQIGVGAPILLTIIRLLQGLSLGGAFSGSIAFVVEHAPERHRGLAGSTSMMSMTLGILGASAVLTVLSNLLAPQQFEQWGWRIPFFVGILAGVVGFYIRDHVSESPKYLEAKAAGTLSKTPLKDVLKHYRGALAQSVGIYLLVTVPFYILVVFMITFMNTMLHHPRSDALLANTIVMFVLLVCGPFSAWLSDKIGRKKLLMVDAVLFLVLIGPIFHMLCQPDFTSALIAQIGFAVLVGFYIGPVPTLLVEIFPTNVRYTGMALSYNIAAAIFGGTAPLVATWLIKQTQEIPSLGEFVLLCMGNTNTIVAFYIMLCAVLALVALYFFKDRYNEPLL